MDDYPDPYDIDPDEYEAMMEQDEPDDEDVYSQLPQMKCFREDSQKTTEVIDTQKSLFTQPEISETNDLNLTPTKRIQATQNNLQTTEIIDTQKSLFTQPEINRVNKENENTNNVNSSQKRKNFSEILELEQQNEPVIQDEDIFGFENSKTRKRTIHDVFGDIDDILYEEELSKKKKSRDKESEFKLIDRIVELRKLYREQFMLNSMAKSVSNKTYNTTNYNKNQDLANISTTVPRWPHIPVVKNSGQKVYVRFHSETYMNEEINRVATKNDFKQFTGDTFKSIWDEAQKIVAKIYGNESGEQQQQKNNEIEISDIESSNDLWVEIYKPKKYIELLSDESINRTLLRWIKLWDKVVFNRKPLVERKSSQQNQTAKNNKKLTWKEKQIEMEFQLDEDGRPHHKVVLLCGPPGLGKTTLAHMVARQAGYNVIEINASDDRSVDVFKNVLENATQMKSVLDKENRPNCIILDEIDGAPAPTIEFLVKFISGTYKPKTGRKGQKQKSCVLKRPLICICNDLYAPALRNLRNIAFIIQFPPTASSRLAERLMEIARYQNVKTDLSAVLALCEKTQNDIRSCLSVLHFFKSQNRPVKLTDIHQTSIGQKDIQKNLFTVLNEIFQIQRIKPNEMESTGLMNLLPSTTERMKRVLKTVSTFGEFDRLILGVFENYPQCKFRDFNLAGICEGLDWFVMSDVLNRVIYSEQNFILLPYIQYAFAMWHFLFASLVRPKLAYPSTEYEFTRKKQEIQAILRDLLNGIQPYQRTFVQPLQLIKDLLPYLMEIICPEIKGNNITFFTAKEKEDFQHLINVMLDYNLNYIQERDENGTYKYRLDPSVDKIVYLNPQNIATRQFSYAIKQLIAHHIELEKLQRLEQQMATTRINGENSESAESSEMAVKASGSSSTFTTPVRNPNHLMKLQPKKLDETATTQVSKPGVCRDFFGRITERSESNTKGNRSLCSKSDIWYHYKEGYNNAVRKSIKISYFL